jgi:hypothetical protein
MRYQILIEGNPASWEKRRWGIKRGKQQVNRAYKFQHPHQKRNRSHGTLTCKIADLITKQWTKSERSTTTITHSRSNQVYPLIIPRSLVLRAWKYGSPPRRLIYRACLWSHLSQTCLVDGWGNGTWHTQETSLLAVRATALSTLAEASHFVSVGTACCCLFREPAELFAVILVLLLAIGFCDRERWSYQIIRTVAWTPE